MSEATNPGAIDTRQRTTSPDATPGVLACIIAVLLLVHLSGDIVFGFESGNTNLALGTVVLGAWLAAVIALAARAGYALVLFVSCLAPAVPLIHMSGTGIADDIEGTGVALLLFIWTTIALGALGPIGVMVSLQGLWRCRQSLLGFLFWSLIPLGLGGGLLAFVLVT